MLKNITSSKDKKEEEEKPLRFLKMVEKPVPRPPTPKMNVPDLVRADFFIRLKSKLA